MHPSVTTNRTGLNPNVGANAAERCVASIAPLLMVLTLPAHRVPRQGCSCSAGIPAPSGIRSHLRLPSCRFG